MGLLDYQENSFRRLAGNSAQPNKLQRLAGLLSDANNRKSSVMSQPQPAEWNYAHQLPNQRIGGDALEAPMVSPDDLIGTGIPAKAIGLLAMSGKALAAKAGAGGLLGITMAKGSANGIMESLGKSVINMAEKPTQSAYRAFSDAMVEKYGAPWVPKATMEEVAELERLRAIQNQAIDAAGRKSTTAAPAVITLYHGSADSVPLITDGGRFGGVFASEGQGAAGSHGQNIHEINLNRAEIASNSNIDTKKSSKYIASRLPRMGTEERSAVERAIIKDEGLYRSGIPEQRLKEIFGAYDIGDADLEAQKIRGELAKAHGFKAVEMADEHGTSYLVLPGAQIKPSRK